MRPLRATDYPGIDLSIDIVLWGIVIVGIFSFVILLYGLWRFSAKRNPVASRTISPAFRRLVFLDIAVLVFDIALLAVNIYFWADLFIENDDASIRERAAAENAEVIYVKAIGRQFFWTFLYPGPDGQWDTNDDIIRGNTLVLPVDAYVVVDITANDVLHSFFLPHFRIKYDAIPGINTRVWFKTTQPGQYEIACAELCGSGHYKMRGVVEVLPKEQYQEWLAQVSGDSYLQYAALELRGGLAQHNSDYGNEGSE